MADVRYSLFSNTFTDTSGDTGQTTGVEYKNVIIEKGTGSTNIGEPAFTLVKRPGYNRYAVNVATPTTGRGIFGLYRTPTFHLYTVADGVFYRGNNASTGDSISGTDIVFQDYHRSSDTIVLHNNSILYTVTSIASGNPVVTGATDVDIPTTIKDGIVVMDDYVFLLDGANAVHNCTLGDPTDWPGNSISLDVDKDYKIRIIKYLDYVVVFSPSVTTFLYNAGNATGSPLSVQPELTLQVGLASSKSPVVVENSLYFVARDQYGRLYPARIRNNKIEDLSDEYIDKWLYFLDSEGVVYSETLRGIYCQINNKPYYIIQSDFNGSNAPRGTLAYDIQNKVWLWWTINDSVNGAVPLSMVEAASLYGESYFLEATGKTTMTFRPASYHDQEVDGTNQNIYSEIRGPVFDWGTLRQKECDRLMVACVPSSTTSNCTIDWSDDFYKSWSTARTVDLSKDHPRINRLGSFKSRAFRIKHSANESMRISALELNVRQGDYGV